MHCTFPGYDHSHTAYDLSPEPRFWKYVREKRINILDDSQKDEHAYTRRCPNLRLHPDVTADTNFRL